MGRCLLEQSVRTHAGDDGQWTAMMRAAARGTVRSVCCRRTMAPVRIYRKH